ncbi:MAG TPA: hypothetical protein VE028_04070 [Nitratidesulfovibrio sp.]|nr:hypothetical protein [Nitratidesulfovibrio sp.]
MSTIATNFGRGCTRYKLVVTDVRDIRIGYRVWEDEVERASGVCVEAVATFAALMTDRVTALRAGFNEWLAAKEAERAARAAKMQEAA